MAFIFEIIRLGIKNLGLHKLRSTLTSLGIILGVAAVIVVVAIGEGNKQSTLRQITALGATNIIIRSQKPPSTQSASTSTTFVVEYGLKRQDLRRLRRYLGDAMMMVPLKASGSEIRRRNERTVSQVFGTEPSLAEAANLRVREGGRYLVAEDRPEHSSRYPRVNVLGRRPGVSSGPVLHLNGHLDVVPPGAGWTQDPFGGLVLDGRLYGRGSADMKAGIAAAVYAPVTPATV